MHPQIEKYLEQVKAQLKNMSAERRSEEVREIGLHLQALVEEGMQRGVSEGEAIKIALSQFGPHQRVGRELNKAVRNGEPHRLPKVLSVMTFLMVGQAFMNLCTYCALFVPVN